MMDRNKQTEVQTEVSYLTLSEFLQSTPPNQWRYISDLSVSQHVGAYASVSKEINKCKLELYCSNDLCNGFRFFRCAEVYEYPGPHLRTDTQNYLYVIYQCSNCQKTQKVYSLAVILLIGEQSYEMCRKLGELPPYGQPIPSRLIKLIGPDRDIFL